MLDSSQSVASAVLDHSECAAIFAAHRIDFCCRGELSIEEAAKDKGLDAAVLMKELNAAIAQRSERSDDPRALPTERLLEHIVRRHHDYLRKALPFVRTLAVKVSRVHGDHNPKLRDLETAVLELCAVLLPHLDSEEQSLFVALTAAAPDLRAISAQLSSMRAEHLQVAALLERVRAAADQFRLPDWACNSYRTLFAELEDLERDVHLHVHLENHVLAPRFAAA